MTEPSRAAAEPGRAAVGGAEPEVVLAGGNMTPVVRVGDTVRRRAGPWTPTIHALLRHVRTAGFTLGPEPLGLDGHGREILSLLPGRVATYPLPAFVLSDAMLATVARTLRAYHDATAGFAGPAEPVWQWPATEPAEVVCHNDFAPYNLAFRDGLPVGAIDFEAASPGPRAWDLAYLAYRLVPLAHPSNPDLPLQPDPEARLARLCDAYGDIDPAAVLALVPPRLDALAAGAPPAHAARYRADAAYLRARG